MGKEREEGWHRRENFKNFKNFKNVQNKVKGQS
jgi:hypothetical protein